MNKHFFLLLLLILLSALSYGQLYKLSGIVTDKNKDQLALASVEIKELKKGTISKDDGSFNFFLERGKYTLVVSMMGYQPIVRTVYINNEDVRNQINYSLNRVRREVFWMQLVPIHSMHISKHFN